MKVATQMGNQGTAEQRPAAARSSWSRPASSATVTRGPRLDQSADLAAGHRPAQRTNRRCPQTLHWDLWLGTAPERPYSPAYHPFNWRGWWDFGTGALGDMACHTVNMAFMALKLGYPMSVEAETSKLNPETYPAWARIRYEFPARGDMPPVNLTWYEGNETASWSCRRRSCSRDSRSPPAAP